jgi:NAD(P)-dependent dehydrogenase (short-subunit alcohol dehydrogenase family)
MATHKPENSFSRQHPNGEGVLITGCSSGIGRAAAVHLARRGFTVFATVRKESDVQSLSKLNEPNLVPTYPLDLNNMEHIPNVVQFVTKQLSQRGKEGLYAIINNAGGGFIAPVELTNLNEFRIELETRLLGPIALPQAFLPMIRKAKGKIVWIVSPALMPIPHISNIHACDFAVNCIARTLQIELKPWKIPNIHIRCGGIKTAAPGKTARQLKESFQQWPRERSELYAQSLKEEQKVLEKFDKKRTEPEEVAKVVFKALCARKPKRRYLVGYMARTAAMVEYLPQSLVDFIMEKRM